MQCILVGIINSLSFDGFRHDIHMMVDGDAARDVAWNFIERWNHALRLTHISHPRNPWADLTTLGGNKKWKWGSVEKSGVSASSFE